jgi:hypothetical protein
MQKYIKSNKDSYGTIVSRVPPPALAFVVCDGRRCLPYAYRVVVRAACKHAWVGGVPRNRVDAAVAVTRKCLEECTCIAVPDVYARIL